MCAEDSKYGGPEEPLRKDDQEGKRKAEREAHQIKKKRLKRHWKKIKDKQVCKYSLFQSCRGWLVEGTFNNIVIPTSCRIYRGHTPNNGG